MWNELNVISYAGFICDEPCCVPMFMPHFQIMYAGVVPATAVSCSSAVIVVKMSVNVEL